MKILLRTFADFREIIGTREMTLTLQDGETVGGLLKDLCNAQFPGPSVDNLRVAACDDGDLDARADQHLDAVSVPDIEGFELIAVVVEDDAPVRQDTVHIEDKELYPRRGGSDVMGVSCHKVPQPRGLLFLTRSPVSGYRGYG
jgi:hypothetical protein